MSPGSVRLLRSFLWVAALVEFVHGSLPSWYTTTPYVCPNGGPSPCNYCSGNNYYHANRCGTYAYDPTGKYYCWCDNPCIGSTFHDCCSDVVSTCYHPTLSSQTPSYPQTDGSTSLTLTGTQFFDNSAGDCVFKMYNVPITCSIISGTQMVCPIPELTTASFPASDSSKWVFFFRNTYMQNASFSMLYAPPAITSVSPASAPTGPPATTLTITGTSFGPTGSTPVVTVGGIACPVSGTQTHTQVTCTLPYGVGKNLPVYITAHNQSDFSGSVVFSYQPPTASLVTTSTSKPTAGNVPVTIQGANFGPPGNKNRTVVFGGTSLCPIVSSDVAQTQIVCTLPAGQGTGVSVVVTVGGQSVTAPTFNYDPPTISRLKYSSGPTVGSANTIYGANFGTPSASVNVWFGNTQANNIVVLNHTTLTVSVPSGVGQGIAVVVLVSGQLSSSSVTYSYNPPVIYSWSPAAVNSSGNVVVTFQGVNYGSSPQVTVDGVYQTLIDTDQYPQTDGQVNFVMPPGSGPRSIIIYQTASSSSSTYAFTYSKPVLLSVSPRISPTAGGGYLIITGDSFGALQGTVTVGTNACSVQAWSHTRINCTIPAGVGANLAVTVATPNLGSSQKTGVFSYSPPLLTAGQAPSPGPTSGGVFLVLVGTNIGTVSGSATVTVGGNPCVVQESIIEHTDTQIICRTPAGYGVTNVVKLTVAGQTSANALNYAYNPPSLSGPPTVGSMDTAGGASIGIQGASFGASPGNVTFFLPRGVRSTCSITSWGHSSIVCSAPPGRGLNIPVSVFTMDGRSTSFAVTYNPPTVSYFTVTTAPTIGGTPVTITGTGFGTWVSGLTVTIGGRACTVTSAAQTQLACTLPARGSSANLAINVTADGQSSSNSIQFAYDPPAITSVSPVASASDPTTGANTIGGSKVTITGTNFGGTGLASAYVNAIGTNCTNVQTLTAQTQLTCIVPAGPGGSFSLFVQRDGLSSNGFVYYYQGPTLSKVILPGPTLKTTGQQTVTLLGTNFGSASSAIVVAIGTQCASSMQVPPGQCLCTSISHNHTYLTCKSPDGQGAAAPVTVSVAGVASAALAVAYAAPTLTKIVPATLPTVGGAVSVIGTDFGVGYSGTFSITIGGAACTTSLTFVNSTMLTCVVGEGSGLSKSVVVSIAQQTASNGQVVVNYQAPVVTQVSPTSATTDAVGVTITIKGKNFGSAVVQPPRSVVLTDGASASWPCVLQPGSTQTQLMCYLSPGQGALLYFVVTVDGQSSATGAASQFGFLAPTIQSITPTGGFSTQNPTTVTLSGSSFGLSGTVRVAGVPCAGYGVYSHSNVECRPANGTGANLNVSITVGNSPTFTLLSAFSFAAPTITSLSTGANSPGTAGGYPLTVVGTNFGASGGAISVMVGGATAQQGGVSCSPVSIQVPHLQVTCTMPAGSGKQAPVYVVVSGQTSTSKAFAYAAPTVSSVSSTACTQSGSAVTLCPFGTNVTITVTGTNFAASGASVTVGSAPCYLKTQTQTTATCVLLPWSQAVFSNLNVVVNVNQQSSAAAALVSFAGPSITSLSCSNGDCNTVPVAGGTTLTITGVGFDSSTASNNIITYGPAGTPTKYSCATTSATTTTVKCTTAAGIGKSYVVQADRYMSAQLTLQSVASTQTVSYAPPYILPGTLRGGATSPASTSLLATVSIGQYIQFSVNNTGANAADLTVTMVPPGGGASSLPCSQVQLKVGASSSNVSCVSTKGTGVWVFVVTVGNQASAPGTDTFSYPVPPTVTGVSGCTDVGNTTINCPTVGGSTMTVTGTSFTLTSMSVVVGGSLCPILSIVSSTRITCQLPAGVGAPVPVHVSTGVLESLNVNLVSYKAPVLATITGCGSSSPSTAVVDCSRTSHPLVTITGMYFGQASAVVFVGEYTCTNVVHDTVTPDQKVTCKLPSTSGLQLAVFLMQGGGQVSTNSLLVSYVPCAPGYAEGAARQVACVPCQAGYYTNTAGVLSCMPCPPGSWNNQTLATSCATCAPGTYAVSPANVEGAATSCAQCPLGTANPYANQTSCQACQPGSYASRTGSTSCALCDKGTATIKAGQSACPPCTNGTFANLQGSTSCTSCSAGTYAPNQKSSTCLPCPTGTASSASNAVSCQSCGVGYAQSQTGQVACTACLSGTFTSSTNQPTCKKCDAGSYSDQSIFSDACLSCAPGKFSSAPGQGSCTPCPQGTYQPGSGNTTCLQCPAGSYSNAAGATSCASCAIGKYAPNPGTIECLATCPAGTFSSSKGQTACTQCQPGRYNPYPGQTGCQDCPAGNYTSSYGQVACQICGTGTYSPASGYQNCTACDRGTFQSSPGQSSCQPCDAGTYQDSPGQPICIDCPVGYANPSPNGASCTACPPGQYASGTKSKSCTACPAGTFSSSHAQSTCQPCPAGTFANSTGNAVCTSCPAGQYQDQAGQTQCLPCDIGNFAPLAGQSACLPCAPGSFGNATGLTQCYDCPVGTAQASPGLTRCAPCAPGSYASVTGLSACVPCPPGYVNPRSGATSCTASCPVGTYSLQGASACTSCAPGYVSTANASSVCTACDIGFYRGASDPASACVPAPPGYYVNSIHSTAPMKCQPGQWQPASRQTGCQQCPAGTYQPQWNSSSCLQCPAGRYSSAGMATCQPCAQGTYSAAPGATSCTQAIIGRYVSAQGANASLACPPGTAQSQPGQASCSACLPGHYADAPGSSQCQPCPVTTFNGNMSSSGPCTLCPLGTYNGATGQPTCTLCPKGAFANSIGLSACPSCDPGTFANTTGSLACSSCAPGTYSTAAGSTKCTACQPGTFLSTSGSKGPCSNCPPGRFSSTPGSTSCTLCPSGTYQSHEQQQYCLPCGRGQRQPLPGQPSCEDCPIGRFGSGAGNCTFCGPGTFQDVPGQMSCRPCPPGFFSDHQGASACAPCGVGEFSLGGASACALCPIGKYQTNISSTACRSCGPGHSTSQPGSQQCYQCPAGYHKPPVNDTDDAHPYPCLVCPPGTAQANPGSLSCVACGPGNYTSGAGSKECDLCPTGSFSTTFAASNCTACPPGTYNGTTGATTCTTCAPGTGQPLPGQDTCPVCLGGQYSSPDGRACLYCPGGTYSNANRTGCLACSTGEFAPPGSATCSMCGPGLVATTGSTTVCSSCPTSAFPNPTHDLCLCAPGFYMLDGACYACPLGADCTAPGTTNSTMFALQGFWRTQSGQFYRCKFQTDCPETQTLDGQCLNNRQGPLCAQCIPGYQSTWGNQCLPCPARAFSIITFVCLVTLVVAIVLLQLYLMVRAGSDLMRREKQAALGQNLHARAQSSDLASSLVEQSTTGSVLAQQQAAGPGVARPPAAVDRRIELVAPPNFMFKMKILLGFFQITTNLSSSLDVPWPPQYKIFLSYFTPFNFDLTGVTMIGCVFATSYYTTLISAVVTPIASVLGITLGYLLPRQVCAGRDRPARKRSRRRYWRMVLFLLFLFYPGTSSIILRQFVCVDVEGVSYMLSDMQTQCYTPTWYAWAKISPLFIALYPVGVPLFFIWAIWRVRHRLFEPGIKAQVGFLYDAFSPRMWWFDIVDTAHKLFLTSLLPFFGRSYNIPVGMGVTVLYTMVILAMNPYQRKGDDRLHLLVQIGIFLYMVAAYTFIANNSIDTLMDIVISVVLIAFTVLLMAFFFAQAALFLRKTLCPRLARPEKPEPVYVEQNVAAQFGASASVAALARKSRKKSKPLKMADKMSLAMARERQSVNPLYNQQVVHSVSPDEDVLQGDVDYGGKEVAPSARHAMSIQALNRNLAEANADAFTESVVSRRSLAPANDDDDDETETE